MDEARYKYLYAEHNQGPIKLSASRKHTFSILIVGMFSLLFILTAVNLANTRTSWFGRAQTPSISTVALSRENSYVFASPISAPADGAGIIRISVFVLNNQGLGVSGQSVSLKVDSKVIVSATQPVTDSLGRAIYDLTSTTAGSYTVTAEASGVSLPQTVSIAFL